MAKYNSKGHRRNSDARQYLMIPLAFVLFFIPLITRLYMYDPGLSEYKWFANSTEQADLFLFWKSVALITTAVVMTITMLLRLGKDRLSLKKDYWIWFVIAYGGLTLVSTLVSPYRKYGFSGIYEQFESVWVILSYCVVMVYAYYVVRHEKDLLLIRKALFGLVAILSVLGLSQLVDMDFFESTLGRWVIVPGKYAYLRPNLVFNFADSGLNQVYMTLYNPNYVGTFAALVFPIIVMLIFISEKIWNKILWAVLSMLLLVTTFGSGSKSFILAMSGILLLAVFFCRKLITKYIKLFIPLIVMAVVVCVVYFGMRGINPIQYVKNALVVSKNDYALENFEGREDGFVITYNGEELKAQYEEIDGGVYFLFTDNNGMIVNYEKTEDGVSYLLDDRFKDITFALFKGSNSYPYYGGISINGIPILFVRTEEGYRYVNSCGKIDEVVHAESAIFTEYDRLATRRGYIWSRSIPLLKDYLILGAGADSFALVFPHNDYVARYNVNFYNELITKPHNLYLQIAVQHGVLALLSFLTVALIYFFQSFRLYWNVGLDNSKAILGIGIMLGVIGYMIAGIANDSCVAIAPLFWAWLGIGFAVNRMNHKEMGTK